MCQINLPGSKELGVIGKLISIKSRVAESSTSRLIAASWNKCSCNKREAERTQITKTKKEKEKRKSIIHFFLSY